MRPLKYKMRQHLMILDHRSWQLIACSRAAHFSCRFFFLINYNKARISPASQPCFVSETNTSKLITIHFLFSKWLIMDGELYSNYYSNASKENLIFAGLRMQRADSNIRFELLHFEPECYNKNYSSYIINMIAWVVRI